MRYCFKPCPDWTSCYQLTWVAGPGDNTSSVYEFGTPTVEVIGRYELCWSHKIVPRMPDPWVFLALLTLHGPAPSVTEGAKTLAVTTQLVQ